MGVEGGGERGVTVQIRVKGMTQLMYCYTDSCSMYSGVPLIWVTVIDTKVHFSMKTEDCMLVELYYDTKYLLYMSRAMLDASHTSVYSLFTATQ